MTFAIENLRLAELAAVTEQNKPFFDDFVFFLRTQGYANLHAFIEERNSLDAIQVLTEYFNRPIPPKIHLYDGVARPYAPDKAKWLLVAWVLRDAPEQRLRPMLSSIAALTPNHRQAILLNTIREHVRTFLHEPERWTWPTIAEVMMDRLEGSRRAIKGTLFEAVVRRLLTELFEQHRLALTVSKTEIRLEGETYDVIVTGPRNKILIPVKTRETMGGGHAMLFTRDIHKSISVAKAANLECIPVVIAESWKGDLQSLNSRYVIHVDKNPNQLAEVETLLRAKLSDCLGIFIELAG